MADPADKSRSKFIEKFSTQVTSSPSAVTSCPSSIVTSIPSVPKLQDFDLWKIEDSEGRELEETPCIFT